MQTLAPAVEYTPTPQFVQTVAVVEPVTVEIFPAAHDVQAVKPTTSEYFPATHVVQLPGVPDVPIAQPGATHTLEPTIDVLPDSQAIQGPVPEVEYVLTGHELH